MKARKKGMIDERKARKEELGKKSEGQKAKMSEGCMRNEIRKQTGFSILFTKQLPGRYFWVPRSCHFVGTPMASRSL
jgi:hypothetical protein